jgi:AmmeMemoRadiSam system protein B
VNPKLRPIRAQPFTHEGKKGILLEDPLRLSPKAIFIPGSLTTMLALLDGSRDVGTITTGFELRTGLPISARTVKEVLTELDEALFLENERFAEAYSLAVSNYREAPSRPPTMVGRGCPSDARQLGSFLAQFVSQVDGDSCGEMGRIVGLISPHIDFSRGGRIYAQVWSRAASALKETELVVILGTDHSGEDSGLALTRQDYETPWGVLPTARELVDEYSRVVGEARAFDREFNHSCEHSVESAVIWLHYFLGSARCEILPILCGTFHEFITSEESPLRSESIKAIVDIISRVRETRQVLVVAAADLAHIGPVFGDVLPVDLRGRSDLAKADQRLLEIVKLVDAERLMDEVKADGDKRRICGLAPIYLTLSVLSGATGVVTGYEQCPASNDGTSLVSVCGVTFHSGI